MYWEPWRGLRCIWPMLWGVFYALVTTGSGSYTVRSWAVSRGGELGMESKVLSTQKEIYALFCMFFLVSGLIVMFCGLYLMFFRMNELLSHLSHSVFIQKIKWMIGAGLYGRLYVFSMISMLLVFSRFSIRRGYLDLEDYNNFPRRLRMWLKILDVSTMFVAVLMLALWVVGKVCGFIPSR